MHSILNKQSQYTAADSVPINDDELNFLLYFFNVCNLQPKSLCKLLNCSSVFANYLTAQESLQITYLFKCLCNLLNSPSVFAINLTVQVSLQLN